MVIYDFAGQQEYYSSHAAVLERRDEEFCRYLCLYRRPEPVYGQDQ